MRSLSFLDTVLCMVAIFLLVFGLSSRASQEPAKQSGFLLVTVPYPPAGSPEIVVAADGNTTSERIKAADTNKQFTSVQMRRAKGKRAGELPFIRLLTEESPDSLALRLLLEPAPSDLKITLFWPVGDRAHEKERRTRLRALVAGARSRLDSSGRQVVPLSKWNTQVLNRFAERTRVSYKERAGFRGSGAVAIANSELSENAKQAAGRNPRPRESMARRRADGRGFATRLIQTS